MKEPKNAIAVGDAAALSMVPCANLAAYVQAVSAISILSA